MYFLSSVSTFNMWLIGQEEMVRFIFIIIGMVAPVAFISSFSLAIWFIKAMWAALC